MQQLYFFELQDQIQNHFIAAVSKEQAAEVFLRQIKPSGDIEVEFLTHSGLQGLAEGSMPPERISKLGLDKLEITNSQYIDKELITAKLFLSGYRVT